MIGILAEKPSQARNFAKALGGITGTYNGESYTIVAARGHLYEFATPEEQVPASLKETYKSWNVANLPWDESLFSWKRVAKDGASQTIKQIKDTLSRCAEIVIATDNDPTGEGELLAWEVLSECNLCPSKWSRMYFADESAKEVQKAFSTRKTIPSMMQDMDYVKALYRSQWDFLSMQFTRIASAFGGGRAVLRQGRLKSAMVLLVGDQLKAVENYKAVPFYSNQFKDERGIVYTSKDEPVFASKNEVPQTYQPSKVVLDVTQTKQTAPPRLIDLASLSAKLSSKYSAKQVLATYQKMYEAQVVSYPRTEDKHITLEQFNELLPLADKIASVIGVDASFLTHKTPRKTHIKQGCAHGANRPGLNVPNDLASLSSYGPGAVEIYTILARNYLAMLCEDYVYEQQRGYLELYPSFFGSANVPKIKGWKNIYDDDDEELDVVSAGLGIMATPYIHEGFPPKPTTPSMRWLMKQLEKHDVGTGATRTSTYAEVTNEKTKYPLLVDKKGKITMSEFGRMSYGLLPGTHIGSLALTKQVLEDMRLIASGTANPNELLKNIRKLVIEDIETMKKNGEIMRKELNIVTTQKEKYTGTWDGVSVSFTKTWSGHTFTDEECEALCRGETITFDAVSARTGKPFTATGALSEQTYNGRKFVGFALQPRQSTIPDTFCGHTFTDAEKTTLESGGTVAIKDAVSKKGNTFSCEVSYGKKDDGSVGLILSFSKDIPTTWCKYTFTDDERNTLKQGGIVHIKGAVSKKGNIFECDVKAEQQADGAFVIVPMFS